MNIRIISGKYGGRSIKALGRGPTHPMGERIRMALFNKIYEELDGAVVLDAFAGTGALGIEALSRGAKQATFIERDRRANKILKDNIKLLELEDSTRSPKVGLATWIDSHVDLEFDIIFADPPYDNLQLSTVEKLFGLLKPGGLMILSTPGRCEVSTGNGIVVVDNRSYGNANLTFYRRRSA